jgi:hypothetical protein
MSLRPAWATQQDLVSKKKIKIKKAKNRKLLPMLSQIKTIHTQDQKQGSKKGKNKSKSTTVLVTVPCSSRTIDDFSFLDILQADIAFIMREIQLVFKKLSILREMTSRHRPCLHKPATGTEATSAAHKYF